MRSCNAVRLHYSQSAHLPILPFLAPRVFSPWPNELSPDSPPNSHLTDGQRRKRTTRALRSSLAQCNRLRIEPQTSNWSGSSSRRSLGAKRHFSSATALPNTKEEVDSNTKQDDQRLRLDFQSPTEAQLSSDINATGADTTAKLDVFEDEEGEITADADGGARRQQADETAQQWHDQLVQDGDESTLYQSWAVLPPEMRQYRWPLLAEWLARHRDPEQTWEFIGRTLADPFPPEDTLRHLLHVATTAIPPAIDKRQSARLAESMFLALQTCRSQYERLTIPASTLRFVATYSDATSIENIYNYLLETGIELQPSVLYRFAFRFAENKDLRAVDLLTKSALSKKFLASSSVLELCASILRSARQAKSPTRTKPEVLQALMRLGVPLETPVINALIQNAVECDDTETAMRIYSKLTDDRRLLANRTTYLTLLPRLRSPDKLGWFLEVQRNIRRRGIQNFDPQVIHELMIARYRQTKRHHFELMLGLYEVTFSLQPLKQLGIVSETYNATRSDYARPFCGPLPLPTRPIVELMLHVFSYSKPRRILPMVEVYHNLVRLRNEGNPLFLELSRRRSPWTIILKSLCMREATLKAWPQVIRDMESLPLDDEQQPYTHPWTGKPWQPPSASTPHIWNIILNGYARRGHVREAERILELMFQRHIEPDMFTFTPLLRGYATRQDIQGIENTLRRIEVNGHELLMNEHSKKALSPFEDKQALAVLLEESAKRKNNPYTARTADELFESEEEPAIPGSADEFQRWDSFAQAAREEIAVAAKPSKKSERRDAFTQRLEKDEQVLTETKIAGNSSRCDDITSAEDSGLDSRSIDSWTMEDVNPEALEPEDAYNTVDQEEAADVITGFSDSDLDSPRTPEEADSGHRMDANVINAWTTDEKSFAVPSPITNSEVEGLPTIRWGNSKHASNRMTATQSTANQQWTMDEYLSQANSMRFTRSRGRKGEWFYLERARKL